MGAFVRILRASTILVTLAAAAPALAEVSFQMSVPAGAKFTFVVPSSEGSPPAGSPAPVTLRFSRSDPGLFCSKIWKVGVDAGKGQGILPSNPLVDDYMWFSTVGGAPLCNFGFQDNQVNVDLTYDGGRAIKAVRDSIYRCASLSPQERRESHTELFPKGVTFQVYTRRLDGTYQLKAPAQCDQTPLHYCYLPVEVVCEAIPVTRDRPPIEKINTRFKRP